jgi:hypothetical protein
VPSTSARLSAPSASVSTAAKVWTAESMAFACAAAAGHPGFAPPSAPASPLSATAATTPAAEMPHVAPRSVCRAVFLVVVLEVGSDGQLHAVVVTRAGRVTRCHHAADLVRGRVIARGLHDHLGLPFQIQWCRRRWQGGFEGLAELTRKRPLLTRSRSGAVHAIGPCRRWNEDQCNGHARNQVLHARLLRVWI